MDMGDRFAAFGDPARERAMLMMVGRVATRLSADQAGSNAIEYGLVVALVSVAVATGAGVAGSAMKGMFMAIGAVYSGAAASIASL